MVKLLLIIICFHVCVFQYSSAVYKYASLPLRICVTEPQYVCFFYTARSKRETTTKKGTIIPIETQ
jgi:hypothetical protein